MKSAQSLDVPFIFNVLHVEAVAEFTGPNPPQGLADDVHAAFRRFARTGEPGWGPWTSEHPVTRLFDGAGTFEHLSLGPTHT